MKILNDQIVFDASDISQFSPGLQKALSLWPGSAEGFYSQAANVVTENALKNAKAQGSRELENLAQAITVADPVKVAQAQVFIDQAKAVLGVTSAAGVAAALNPAADKPVPK